MNYYLHTLFLSYLGENGFEQNRTYGRKSVSPIPKSRDFYGGGGGATEYNHTSRQVGGSNPAARPRYDPYEQIRGGTGYGPDFYRAQPQEQAHQPQQQPTSYGYSQQTRSQAYGYGQQPPATAYGDPYSSSRLVYIYRGLVRISRSWVCFINKSQKIMGALVGAPVS